MDVAKHQQRSMVVSYSGSWFTESKLRDIGVSIHVLSLFMVWLVIASQKALQLWLGVWFVWDLPYVWIMLIHNSGVIWAAQQVQQPAPSSFREYRITMLSPGEARVDLIVKLGASAALAARTVVFLVLTLIKLLGAGNCTGECQDNTDAYVYVVLFAGCIFISCCWTLYRMVAHWDTSTIPESAVPSKSIGRVNL